MKVCNRIRDLIDQSHRADALPPEAAAHAEFCDACRKFAEEREALRSLLAEGTRVTVPGNFNAVLNQRLEAARGKRRGPAWFGQLLDRPMVLRIATAAASIALTAVLVPQYFSPRDPQPAQVASITPAAEPETSDASPGRVSSPRVFEPVHLPAGGTGTGLKGRRPGVVVASRSRTVPLDAAGSGVLLVREGDRDIEMPLPRVTVGAQPIVLGGEGSSSVRMVRASF